MSNITTRIVTGDPDFPRDAQGYQTYYTTTTTTASPSDQWKTIPFKSILTSEFNIKKAKSLNLECICRNCKRRFQCLVSGGCYGFIANCDILEFAQSRDLLIDSLIYINQPMSNRKIKIIINSIEYTIEGSPYGSPYSVPENVGTHIRKIKFRGLQIVDDPDYVGAANVVKAVPTNYEIEFVYGYVEAANEPPNPGMPIGFYQPPCTIETANGTIVNMPGNIGAFSA